MGSSYEWNTTSVIGPLLFLLYINDLPDNIMFGIFLFADNTKVFGGIYHAEDSQELRDDLNKLEE